MFNFSCALYVRLQDLSHRFERYVERGEQGQATAEYALVLLLAAVVAFVVTKYFSKEGGSNPITGIVGGALDKVWGVAKHFVSFL